MRLVCFSFSKSVAPNVPGSLENVFRIYTINPMHKNTQS